MLIKIVLLTFLPLYIFGGGWQTAPKNVQAFGWQTAPKNVRRGYKKCMATNKWGGHR